MNEDHSIIPSYTLKLSLDEREEYKAMTSYMNLVPNSISVILEVNMANVKNIEATKAITELIFQKNVVKVDIVMEMHYPEYVEFLYGLIKQKKSVVEITPILHMSWGKTVDLLKNTPHVKQWIFDIRRPHQGQEASIRELMLHRKNTRYVLRDVREFLIEFRFMTSFEISPMF